MNPFISIIIPTYKRAKMLERCIYSLIKQQYPKNRYEIVVVDDSDDEAKKLVTSIDNTMIKYAKNTHKKGPSGARNTGIEKAKGEIIFFIDDDCIADENWVNEIIQVYRKYPEIIGAGGSGFSDPTQEKNFIIRYIEALKTSPKVELMIGYMETPCFATFNMSYKKSVFLEVGTFIENLKVGEDYNLKKRICKAGYKIAYVPTAIVYHHQRSKIVSYLKHDCFNRGRGYALYGFYQNRILSFLIMSTLLTITIFGISNLTYLLIFCVLYLIAALIFSFYKGVINRLKRVNPTYFIIFYLFYISLELPLKIFGYIYQSIILLSKFGSKKI